MDNFVITIARGFGSGGKEIGMRLSQKLGIPCYERELLAMASKESGIDESLFVEVDEKLRGSYIKKLLTKMPNANLVEPSDKDFISDVNLFNIQAQIIKELARTESCIVIGKCADYLLSDRFNVVSVYVEAGFEDCVKSIMDKMHVTYERAAYLIKKTDKYRANYYKYYTYGTKWNNPLNYDLTLNTSNMTREECVEVIAGLVKTRFGEK